jgi:hypothetical protein
MRTLGSVLVGVAALTAVLPTAVAARDLPGTYGNASLAGTGAGLVCENTMTTVTVRRIGGPLGWLTRLGWDGEARAERPQVAVPITTYLRSPLLSSFFGVLPCPQSLDRTADGAQPDDQCAYLVYRAREGDELLEKIPLPQHGMNNTRMLKAFLQEQHQRGETVHLQLTHGAEVDVAPGSVRDVLARACRM